MGMLLDSKSFLISKDDPIPFDDIRYWLVSVNSESRDLLLTVKLETAGKERKGKRSAASELLDLSCKAALENKEIWQQGDYKFFFVGKKYYWKEKEVHLTAGEALFLFKWLVLHEICYKQMYHLYNMRRRLGGAFLHDVQIEQ
jgi:hypothetical protein